MMTDAVTGRTRDEVEALYERFHDALTAKGSTDGLKDQGELAALAGVREFPMRVKCATLAWHTLRSALAGADEPVTTE